MAGELPPGFVLEDDPGALPPGFVLDRRANASPTAQNSPNQPPVEPSFYDQLRGVVSSVGRNAVGAAEVLGTLATSSIAEPFAGVAGMVQGVNPFSAPGAAAREVDKTRQEMTYIPRTEAGKGQLQAIGGALAPIGEALQWAQGAAGDAGYELAGPIGGAVGASLPTAVMEAVGIGAGRVLGRAGQVAKAVPDDAAQSVLNASKQFGVPVLTSDIRPPKGYAGRFMQGLSEKLGVLGTGQARVQQQGYREAAVQGFAEAMDIDLDSPFAADIVKSVKGQLKAEISAAGRMRDEAVSVLDPAGPVPLTHTKSAMDTVRARHAALKEKADTGLVENVGRIERSLDGGNFTQLKNIRTEVIDDIKALAKSEDTRGVADLEKVKQAIDRDMLTFAARTDKDAAQKWVQSNRAFASAYTRSKDSELKRLMMNGELTPEKVTPLLRGGRPSELTRLYDSMDSAGREAGRRAIIQDALKDSKFFEVDSNPNPDAFATALNRANRQQAINVFFRGAGKAELDGLTRLLDATRRAQQGSTVVKTGEQMVPMMTSGAVMGGVMADPILTGSLVGGTSVLLKAYESRPFRNLLLKIGNTKTGTTAEKRLLDLASATVAGGFQAARTAPEEEKP